ncbi:hypothetical protein CSHISOI_08284 [Colletotrichum shisoi]|uniref:Uncharacterized protein n=1 Tax=Colletotrichum shisoi TaxID=2078593 RepID=A0A5Q4BKX1_9PEZI|nr:hypothetical protein CSHISOI_08284 [Colletotrichum shisoi]
MKAARRCRQAGLPVATIDILSESTISRIARSIEAKRKGAAGGGANDEEADATPARTAEPFTLSLDGLTLPPDVDPDNIACAMPCTPMQGDYYYLFSTKPAPERPGIMTTFYEILFRGGQKPVDPAIVDRHAMFRTRSVPLAELGVDSCRSGPLPPETVMQLVMRQWLVDGAVVHVVLWHIAADFVATGVFQVDFDRFYRRALPGTPGLRLRTAAVEAGTRYWIHCLAGAEPCWIRPHHLGVVDRRPTTQQSR